MKAIEKQVILVTGTTEGIGKQTAHELAKMGVTVLLHARNGDRGEAVLQEIRSTTGNTQLELYIADLASLGQVHTLAKQISSKHPSLDVLINNAGVGFGDPATQERQLSQDGHELRFAVNYLAPFLLTTLLLPNLRHAAPSRIVNVASAGQQSINFDDIMLERHYDGRTAYGRSKLALIMFTFALAERLKADDVTVNTLHPGTFLDTKMVREAQIRPMGSAKDGAAAVIHLATSPQLDGVTGKYFDRKQEAHAEAQAYDAEARRKLWDLSEKLTNVTSVK